MNFIEILKVAADEEKRIVFGRENERYSDYVVHKKLICDAFLMNGDNPQNAEYKISEPEYTGFESFGLSDVFAEDWIVKGVWRE